MLYDRVAKFPLSPSSRFLTIKQYCESYKRCTMHVTIVNLFYSIYLFQQNQYKLNFIQTTMKHYVINKNEIKE